MTHKLLTNGTIAIVLLVVLVVVSILLLNWSFQSTMDRWEWEEDQYVVENGDSLWAISGKYCPDNVDRWEWINEIQALNALDDCVIQPGQMLIVLTPAAEG